MNINKKRFIILNVKDDDLICFLHLTKKNNNKSINCGLLLTKKQLFLNIIVKLNQ